MPPGGPSGGTGVVRVVELAALSRQAYAALWFFLARLDLVTWIDYEGATDEPLPHLLAESRAVRSTVVDRLWIRLVGVARPRPRRTGRLMPVEHCPPPAPRRRRRRQLRAYERPSRPAADGRGTRRRLSGRHHAGRPRRRGPRRGAAPRRFSSAILPPWCSKFSKVATPATWMQRICHDQPDRPRTAAAPQGRCLCAGITGRAAGLLSLPRARRTGPPATARWRVSVGKG